MRGPEMAQAIARDPRLRPAKVRGASDQSVYAGWRARAAEVGFGGEQFAAALAGETAPPAEVNVEEIAARLTGPGGLTRSQATFTFADAMATVADTLEQGATVEELRCLTAAVLDRPDVVPLVGDVAPAGFVARNLSERLYTTTEMAALESVIVDVAQAGRASGAGVCDPAVVRSVLNARPELGEDQTAAIERLCTSGAGLEVVIGAAGSGKSRMLEAACAAWQASGYTVIGAAAANRAARNLGAKAGICRLPGPAARRLPGRAGPTDRRDRAPGGRGEHL